tara:strand:+ start:1954 stop:2244 length:291 start_codon:yes stop_codon:yes gene_type:complete
MVRKKTAKKRGSKRKSSRRASPSKRRAIVSRNKLNVALINLILFSVLSLISFGLYNMLSNEIYTNLFFMTSLILGFVAIAFLMVYLVLVFMKWLKK